MDNKLVRRALSAAIDRAWLVKNVLKGNQIPANTLTAPGTFGSVAGNPDIAPWALDYEAGAAKAKQWLAEAGYPNGQGFPEITLMYNNTREEHEKIAQAIASMWEKTLGIHTKLESKDWKDYLNIINAKTPVDAMPHVWRFSWCSEYPDANNWLNLLFNPSLHNNLIRWDHKTFQEIVEKAEASQDPQERKTLYKGAEQLLCDEEAGVAPIYYLVTVTLTKPWLTRNYPSWGGQDFSRWSIDWEAKKAAKGL